MFVTESKFTIATDAYHFQNLFKILSQILDIGDTPLPKLSSNVTKDQLIDEYNKFPQSFY